MVHVAYVLVALLWLQPAADAPAKPPGESPAPSAPPAPSASAPAAAASGTPTLDELEPASRRAVEKYAAMFIVTQDGTYWDRQVWLERKELRDRLKRSAALPPKPTDASRALGASKDAPADPYDAADGIEWKEWQIKTGETKKGYRYGVDHTNAPLWRSVGDKVAITAAEITAARNAHRQGMSIPERIADEKKYGKVAAVRETVTPEELARAIKDGKAELSEFRWVKRVVRKAEPEKRTKDGTFIHKAEPEEAEYSWVREPVPVKWKKADDGRR